MDTYLVRELIEKLQQLSEEDKDRVVMVGCARYSSPWDGELVKAGYDSQGAILLREG